ncbi:MAG: hypothetical protein ACM3SS_11505 [Rhodospirillaceae bacterium]
MTVLAFRRPEPADPHLSGAARCTSCRHDWTAVAPVGVDWMECPACHLMKGRFLHPAVPHDGEDVWECACGCDVFRVTRAAAFCIGCGSRQEF